MGSVFVPTYDIIHKKLFPRIRRRITTSAVVGAIKAASPIFTPSSKRKVIGHKELLKIVYERRRPLITVSNHTSTIDEPVLWSLLLPYWRILFGDMHTRFRWCLGAEEVMFFNKASSYFFDSGQVIPIKRGKGLNQQGILRSIELLNEGGWIHIMSEGKINTSGFLLSPLRWGIGKLVESSNTTPLVLPIYHMGFDKLMPMKKPYRPHPFQSIKVLVGEPLDFDSLVKENKKEGKKQEETYVAVTKAVELSLIELERKLKNMALEWD